MASQSHGHLDATGDREVVYCHACAHEWYRDEHGLICPSCAGEIIEIVSPDNDPRAIEPHHGSASTSPELPPYRNNDSDPDEADIDDVQEHLRGGNGFIFNSNTRPGVHRDHHQPAMGPVLHRFIDMVNDFGPPGPPRDPWRNPQPQRGAERSPGILHHQRHASAHDDDDFYHPVQNQHRLHHPAGSFGGARIHRTTFSRSPFGGGTASVTIFSAPIHVRRPGSQPDDEAEGDEGRDPFPEIFANVIRDMGAPHGHGDGPNNAQTFASSLRDIMSLFNPQNARLGDAVYSQEALDRIISNLMEANPQSNAAPPASEEGLKKLERKPVDKEMLDNQDKTECSICIDDISEGDMALFLPCKHWFHEQCVVLWLKEHNTCPICRTPIETREERREARESRLNEQNMHNNQNDGSNQAQPGILHPAGNPWVRDMMSSSGGYVRDSPDNPRRAQYTGHLPDAFLNRAEPSTQQQSGPDDDQTLRSTQSARPPSHRHTRLNEAIRSVSAMQERHRDSNDSASTTGVSYDTSRMQRRNSLSPTNSRTAAPGNHSSHRERSPSESSSRWAASDRESTGSQRQWGGGPFSWLRSHLPGGGSGGSSRDERRS